MADNTQLSTNIGTGDKLVTKDVTHGGDAGVKLQGVSLIGVSGSEGSYVIADINGDATNGLDVDVTRLPALPAGTNNIGDVDVLTLPALPAGTNNIGDVDILSIAAGDNNIGNVDIVTLPALPAGTNNIGDVDVLTVPAPLNVVGGGTEAAALRVTLASDSTGVLSIDDNGGSLTVDGTVAVSGTVTVASHAVTNAGTFAVQVDGAALTALQVIDNPVVIDDAAFTPATTSVMMAGFEYDDTTPDSVDEGDAGAARMSANRNQYMQLRDAAGNERGVNVNASNQLSVSVDNTVTVASHAVTNAGTFAVQVSSALPAGTNNIGDIDVLSLPALPAGTNNIGDVDVLTLPAIPTGTNSIGTVQPGNTANTTPWLVTDTAATTGGLTAGRIISAATTNATSVKGSAGQLYTILAHNINAAVRYLKLYNKATAPTVGTDTPVLTMPIPGNTAGAGFVINCDKGWEFSLGVAAAITTGVTDADTGAVAANEIVINFGYK